ncbi:hypothetical protein Vi05172_g2249 [Venturia inaequalis]|nr:hypothetical protein Vi05172_g2249 [Venturia inaequalis]
MASPRLGTKYKYTITDSLFHAAIKRLIVNKVDEGKA